MVRGWDDFGDTHRESLKHLEPMQVHWTNCAKCDTQRKKSAYVRTVRCHLYSILSQHVKRTKRCFRVGPANEVFDAIRQRTFQIVDHFKHLPIQQDEGPVGGPTFEFNFFLASTALCGGLQQAADPKPQPVLAAPLTLPASCGLYRVYFVLSFLNSSLAFALSSCSSFTLSSVSSFCFFVSSVSTYLSKFLTSSYIVLITVFTDPGSFQELIGDLRHHVIHFSIRYSLHFLFRVIVHLPHDLHRQLRPLSDRSCISDLDRPPVVFCIFGTS